MQEEVTEKTIALIIRTGKLTESLLKDILKKVLEEMKQAVQKPKIYKGKQSVKHLVQQGTGISNIEITDQNMKSFEHIARKYGIDFAIKKDTSLSPPKYLVFFKANNADVMTAAFQEFTNKTLQQEKKPSVLQQLNHYKENLRNATKEKNKYKQREESR